MSVLWIMTCHMIRSEFRISVYRGRLMKRILILCFSCLIVMTGQAGASGALEKVFDDYRRYLIESDPFNETGAGRASQYHRVPSVSADDYQRRAETSAELLTRLKAIDRGRLSDADQVNADLLAFILKHDVALAAFRGYRMPFRADTGFHTEINYVVSATPFRSAKDYEDYLQRLAALPGFLQQNIDNMRAGLAVGFSQPKEILPRIIPSFEAMATTPAEDHTLYAPFASMPATMSQSRQHSLQARGKAVLNEEVIPAFAALAAFMKDEYAPNARDSLGTSKTPNGRAYYKALVRYYTTLDDVTPNEIHKIGLKEVARIRKEMMEVIDAAGFDGTFDEFLDYLRTDRRFYAKTPQEMLDRAAWIAKDIDGRLPAYFGKLPRQPYSVEPVPDDIAPNYTNARYVDAPLDADRGGQFWVNTYKIEIRPMYQLTAMALHEAVPGHHLQIALSKEIENVPDFRKGYYPHAYGEGWGLYSEKLGVEMGVYETPYDDFGRLTWEMWRACRLVIDTGIHAKGWTRQQAVDYLAGNTALSLHNVGTEVDRYIAWPGQALAYKMGELTLWELRAKAEKELGDDFDIREFHDAVLVEGGLPLEMLRDQIDRYIEEKKEN